MSADAAALARENARLAAQVARLRAAVAHYADEANWTRLADDAYARRYRPRGRPGWTVARAALAQEAPP